MKGLLRFFAGWKGLGRFWALTAGLVACLATTLQLAGAPPLLPAPAALPMRVAKVPLRSGRPRIALLVGGIGISLADSTAAIARLPASVSLAVPPQAGNLERVLPLIQTHGHEYLLSVPMEPVSFPLDDPDSTQALMLSLTEQENDVRLRAILSRAPGYVGLTNVFGPLDGGRLMETPDLFDVVQRAVAKRGLFFLEAGDQKLQVAGRQADLILDDAPFTDATLAARLDELAHIALDKGSAVGIITLPRPVTLDRAVAWSQGLARKGIDLVPVSELISF
jgi:polysaccharide deacetylase 2 family uncharacterized protein YibQ